MKIAIAVALIVIVIDSTQIHIFRPHRAKQVVNITHEYE